MNDPDVKNGDSGEIGIKQVFVPAGCIPIVAVDKKKIVPQQLVDQLQQQANEYGKAILRLCRFVFAEELMTLEPK